jgi:hypothetical protein
VSKERMSSQTDCHIGNISDKPPSEDVQDQSHLKCIMLSASRSGDNPENVDVNCRLQDLAQIHFSDAERYPRRSFTGSSRSCLHPR